MKTVIDKTEDKDSKEKYRESLIEGYKNLHENEEQYQEELEEMKLWDNTLMDGLEDEWSSIEE
jgi:hypothetical protein